MKRSQTFSKLITLARDARKKVEALSRVEGGPSDLTGYCGVAARYVELSANSENIFPEFVAGSFRGYNRIFDKYFLLSGHTWLEYEGHIVDITATQFKEKVFGALKVERDFGQKVYICKNTNPHYSKNIVGLPARKTVRMWYTETLEEICQKIDEINK